MAALVRPSLVVLLLAACSMGPAYWQSTNLQPLNVGWQQFFRVQWSPGAFQEQPIVEGYITNVWGFWARNIQLLVSGYDSGGILLGQLVGWGPNAIGSGGRVYFNVAVPPAATYDVAIFAWDWVLDDDFGEFNLLR
jgi:hypothetical protein